MKDCETTITLDLGRFPREYWTGDVNPYLKLDEQQLDDVDNWVRSLVPDGDEYCVEIVGKCPGPVAMLIGAILQDTGCQKLTSINPGRGVLKVWDYTEAVE